MIVTFGTDTEPFICLFAKDRRFASQALNPGTLGDVAALAARFEWFGFGHAG